MTFTGNSNNFPGYPTGPTSANPSMPGIPSNGAFGYPATVDSIFYPGSHTLTTEDLNAPGFFIDAAHLPNLRNQLTKTTAGTGDTSLGWAGDSLTRGTGDPAREGFGPPSGLVSALTQRGFPAVNGAIVPAAQGQDAPAGTFYDPRCPQPTPSGWTNVGASNYGIFFAGEAIYLAGNVGAANYSITPGVLADTYDIYYVSNAIQGSFTATATGGTATSINAATGNFVFGKTTITAASASASNTVTFSNVTVAQVQILSIVPRLSTKKQIIVHNFGIAGAMMNSAGRNWAATTVTPNLSSLNPLYANFLPTATLLAHGLSCLIMCIGVNDFGNGQTVPTIWTDMVNFQNTMNAGGCDVIWVVGPTTGPNGFYSQSTLTSAWAQIKARLIANHFPFYDWQARTNPWSQYNSYGWAYADQIHWVRAGYDDAGLGMAISLAPVL